ncbi:MAG: hypothetical protein M3R27_16875 [Bacteroidota bacterium]|nr:hypothetical protein [Bacteroidota bacterium]
MNRICFLVCFVLLLVQSVYAQNIKDETIEYRYIKLPLTPLPASIKNYQSSVFATYEAENTKKKEAYEAEKKVAELAFQKEKEVYPAKVKAADDNYAMEMEAWKKKSFGEKLVEKEVLKENNKPVKQTPPAPYLRTVQEPQLQTSYDYPVIANTYLILDGYTNKPENAVKIDVTIYGFEYTEPRQLSELKNLTSYANGQTTTNQVNYYHYEFSYRHTMSVKVTAPDGKEMLSLSPQELNTYKVFKSPESTTAAGFNRELLIKTNEEKIFQENLNLINNVVNDKFGYKRVVRPGKLFYVKSKDETYQDLLIAFNDASSGLKLILDDSASAKLKLQSAITKWNTALQESDVKNKKARIDKDVTTMIYFNLLESYFALGDVVNGEKTIASLNTIGLSSSERKQKDDFEGLFNDLKKRILSNK